MRTPLQSRTKTAPTPSFTPARNSVLQRKCACGGTPGPTGECAGCRRKRALQPKLTVNQPGDRYEQEADRVAEQVMRMSAPQVQRQPVEEEEEQLQAKEKPGQTPQIQRTCSECEGEVQRQPIEEEEELLQPKAMPGQTPQIQRMCSECEEDMFRQPIEEEEEMLQAKELPEQMQRQPIEEEEEMLQAKEKPGTSLDMKPGTAAHIKALNGGGSPLPEPMRAFFEPRFGHDFGHVRLHNDNRAHQTAQGIHARAFTMGSNIVFGRGQYAPGTTEGKRLLAHELTHVIQQHNPTGNGAGGTAQPRLGTPSSPTLQRQLGGIRLPTGMRWLTAGERRIANPMYGSSLNYTKILLSNALGLGGRPFTVLTPFPVIGPVTVINIGPSAYNSPGSNRGLLIHELAHSWQSQHHLNPAQYMVNSIASQAAAGSDAYCYKPGKWFGFYAAEQIAQQVENGEAPIVSHVKSVSPGTPDFANMVSLTVPRWETHGTSGVRC